jgi:pimeloyl-ACP methyl ester carboxylesterase
MTSIPVLIETDQFLTSDGCRLAVHLAGRGGGRKLLLLHGLFSSAEVNWIKFGTAKRLVEMGFQPIMPDFRAHGESEAPEGQEHYPKEILLSDVRQVIDRFIGEDAFDIAGFSMGARTAAKLLVSGLEPGKAALCGMGLEGLIDWPNRIGFFVDAIDRRDEVKRGDKHWFSVQFMNSQKVDPVAARHLLLSFEGLDLADLAAVQTPLAIVTGTEDADNGSAQDLADKLASAQYIPIPGNHMNCVTKPEFGEAIGNFLRS